MLSDPILKRRPFFSIFHRLVCLVFWRVLRPLGKRRTEFDSAVNDDFGIPAVVEGGKLAVDWDGIVFWLRVGVVFCFVGESDMFGKVCLRRIVLGRKR